MPSDTSPEARVCLPWCRQRGIAAAKADSLRRQVTVTVPISSELLNVNGKDTRVVKTEVLVFQRGELVSYVYADTGMGITGEEHRIIDGFAPRKGKAHTDRRTQARAE